MTTDLDRAERILRDACGERVRSALPMAPLTTFRIGGPAALYLEPQDEPDLHAASRAIAQTAIPFVVIGKGSNLLVSDRGFPGLVIRLGRGYRWAAREGDRLQAGAGMPLPALAGVALRHGLTGLEFGVAIPATLGGAVRMNAGAHGGAMDQVVTSVGVFRLREGASQELARDGLAFTYRRSDLPEDAVVTTAVLGMAPGVPERIRDEMEAAREWRRRTQPLAEPNCGSVFKNPPDGHAAELIEAAGLKGMSAGGAQVSTKHANFIVAGPGATASDVLDLIARVQTRVQARTGIVLEREVHVIGAFDDAA